MYIVYVQDQEGVPLDPTKRFGNVHRMLKTGRAKVVSRKPFTIRLCYEPETHVVHECMGSTDPGRTNIGNAVSRCDNGTVIYTDHVETRNKDIPDLMSDRKKNRQTSRRGERQAKKRLAKRHSTLSTKLDNGRLLPGCEKPLAVKDIINAESCFNNRKREKGWLTPTVRHLIDTHLHQVDKIRSLLPITEWSIEVNKFAFMRMEDGSVWGVDFQNGRMKGYKSVEDYVFALQDGKCACCGEPIYDVHHIRPRHKHGSDGPDNRVGLCDECHHLHHIGELDIDMVGQEQKYGALSVLNQAVPYIIKGLEQRFGEENVHTCFGWQTRNAREALRLPKEHHMDAVAIGSTCSGKNLSVGQEMHYEVKQFRRQDKALIKAQTERTYKEEYINEKGETKYRTVAKNRKPREEQQGPALSQWFKKQVSLFGQKEAERKRSQLKVVPSCRRYNNPDRLMPGTTFLFKHERLVLSGTLTNGQYFRSITDRKKKKTNYPASQCRILTHNTGLVYL